MTEKHDLRSLVDEMVASYRSDRRGQRINRRFTPSREEIIGVIELLLQLFYPGYHGPRVRDEDLAYHTGVLLAALREKLTAQIELCLCADDESDGDVDVPRCHDAAGWRAAKFLQQLPTLRAALIKDVQAAYDGDPAASSLDEIILAYPGFLAVTVYRVAHALHGLGVPLMPRIMTEWAHAATGTDIHPGATIGESFFVDHATGVVVGETSVLGNHVKLYQGVTLGALSIQRDGNGRVIRGTKRHPTVEDHVTIYANATVLGGETVVGRGAVVGGGVFLTRSVGDGQKVALKAPELRVANPGQARAPSYTPDFDI